MSNPIVAVFVSSTWLDLQPERQAVEHAIQRLHETKFIGMEYFGSRDETTRLASLDEVDRSQVYVGIIGGRYGSGITADEYRRARLRHLPCFLYVKAETASPPLARDQEPDRQMQLAAWKDELWRQHIIVEFTTPEDLAAKVTADLHRWLFDSWLKPQLEQAAAITTAQPFIQELLERVKEKTDLPPELLARLRQRGYQLVSGQGNIAVGDDVENSVLVSGSGNVIHYYAPPAVKPAEPAAPKTLKRERRIDAAVPSAAKVGQRIDLLLQVRFPDSPLLGLEQWPLKRKPASLEQAQEMTELEFPLDPLTGQPGKARLQVRLVTPDFEVEGAAEKLLDVPPDEFSKVVSFLLIAKKVGYCRINVEIYDVSQVYLGTVPIEAEIARDLTLAPPQPAYNVANFYFVVAAQGAPQPPSPQQSPAAPIASRETGKLWPSPAQPYSAPSRVLEAYAVPEPKYTAASPAPGARAIPRGASMWRTATLLAAMLVASFGTWAVYRELFNPVNGSLTNDPTPRPTTSSNLEFFEGIEGQVADEAGNPLGGATIQVIGHPKWQTVSTSNGYFFIQCAGPLETDRRITLRAEKPSYQPWQQEFVARDVWLRGVEIRLLSLPPSR